jgi:hypothetical protein
VLRFEFLGSPKLHEHEKEYHFPVFVGAEVLIPEQIRISLDKFIE